VATLRAARLPRFKIVKEDGKEKPTGAKPTDVLNDVLGGDGKIGVWRKRKTC